MDDVDELLDLVDRNDQVIGTILRSQTNNLAKENKRFLRASEAFLMDKTGRLWIPRRHLKKRIAPGGLDYSMGEHVMSGENYIEAALRGFKEELNLHIGEDALKLLYKFPPVRDKLAYFRTVYVYKSDRAPSYNPNDFTEYFWLTPKELVTRLENGELAKNSLKETVQFMIDNPLLLTI